MEEKKAAFRSEQVESEDSTSFESPNAESFVMSSTVSAVVSGFPAKKPISAMDFAEAILKRHPEYGRRSEAAR